MTEEIGCGNVIVLSKIGRAQNKNLVPGWVEVKAVLRIAHGNQQKHEKCLGLDRWVGGGVDGWVDGFKIRFKDCLQQSIKIQISFFLEIFPNNNLSQSKLLR